MKTPYRFKTKPYKHQLDTWEKTKRNKYWAYLFDMGTGKSKLTLDVVAYMYDQGWIDALLVFANKGSYSNWVYEHVPEHLPEHVKYEMALWRSDARVKEKEKIKKVYYSNEMTLKILVMNIEALSFPRSTKVAVEFTRRHNTFVVVDESTTIKNPRSKRTKSIFKIRDLSKARRILTGSCIDNRPLDAWAQYQFLANGILGHTSYYSFRSEYAELVERSVRQQRRSIKVVVGYRNLEKLRREMTQYGTIIKSEDCLDLPPKIYEKFYVELTKEQIKHYNSLRKHAIAVLENEQRVTTKIALTKILRLHQLTCGYLMDDDGNVHGIPHNRLQALDSILDETGGKIIIWATYRHDVESIYNHLRKTYDGDEVLLYYGDTSQEERDKAKRALRRGVRSKVKIMVGNPMVGGYGLNLTGVNTVIYYSNNYDNEIRQQSEKRAHRIGQTNTVTYIDIIARGPVGITVDEKICRTLEEKKNIADLITTGNWRDYI